LKEETARGFSGGDGDENGGGGAGLDEGHRCRRWEWGSGGWPAARGGGTGNAREEGRATGEREGGGEIFLFLKKSK
jgi:hypothetical protein